MGRVKLARPVLYLALTTLLATCAQASVPSASVTLVPFERLSAPSLSAALSIDSLEQRDDAPRFALGAVSLLGEPRSERFHITGDELRPQPLTVFEPSYPKTRVGVFDFLGAPLVGVSSGVSHELHWGCGDSRLGTPEGTGVFLSEDPAGDVDSPNRYAYVGWRPNEATDPTGEIAETPWDAASLGLGLTSLAYNAVEGNWAAAGLDAFGVALDAVATATPFLPGGASVAIKASRGFKALRAIDQGINATQGFFQAGQAYQEGHYFQAGLYGAMSGFGFRGAMGGMDELGLRVVARGTGMNFANVGLVKAERYLISERRVQRYQAHVARLRAAGMDGERLAELQGRIEMTKFGYLNAGMSKLRGTYRNPALGHGPQGLDRVYRHIDDPGDLVVLESKYSARFRMGGDPTFLLSPTKSMGLQMGNPWVEGNIFKMITGPHGLRTNALGWELGNRGYRRFMNVLNGQGESALYGLVF